MNDPRFYERKLVATGDGSHSIYLPAFDEHYHSTHGALRESLHVFIKHGYEELIYKVSARLRILEMGFGTGLNALLTWERNRHVAVSVDYTSLEAFPVDASTAAQLNYPGELKSPDGEEIFMKMHTCPWEVKENFGSNFSLLKLETTLADFCLHVPRIAPGDPLCQRRSEAKSQSGRLPCRDRSRSSRKARNDSCEKTVNRIPEAF
ncbi:MAG: hypothetical protein FD123_1346 [Bacteroidetes bacterium]|nr:MAG: hypothetical protein FD123_1346 [Bacteroidota bacterium]